MSIEMNKPRKWNGTWPSKCQMCKGNLADGEHFYDARTQQGPWGLLCHTCYTRFGVGLGTGFGQKYSTKTLEKVAG